MATAKGGSHPNTRESRPAHMAGRLPICQLTGDIDGYSKSGFQAQFLTSRVPVSLARAALLAPMVWGGNDGR
jgi:hypothetical protein